MKRAGLNHGNEYQKIYSSSISSVVQLSPELLALFHRPGVDALLVTGDELSVLVEHFAVDDRRAAVLSHHAEQHVAVDIFIGERRKRLVIHHDNIRGCACL